MSPAFDSDRVLVAIGTAARKRGWSDLSDWLEADRETFGQILLGLSLDNRRALVPGVYLRRGSAGRKDWNDCVLITGENADRELLMWSERQQRQIAVRKASVQNDVDNAAGTYAQNFRYLIDVAPDPMARASFILYARLDGVQERKREQDRKDAEQAERTRVAEARGWWYFADLIREAEGASSWGRSGVYLSDLGDVFRKFLALKGVPRKEYRLSKSGSGSRYYVQGAKGADRDTTRTQIDRVVRILGSGSDMISPRDHKQDHGGDYGTPEGLHVRLADVPAMRELLAEARDKAIGKKLAQAGVSTAEVDWRPGETIPEDHYALNNPRGRA